MNRITLIVGFSLLGIAPAFGSGSQVEKVSEPMRLSLKNTASPKIQRLVNRFMTLGKVAKPNYIDIRATDAVTSPIARGAPAYNLMLSNPKQYGFVEETTDFGNENRFFTAQKKRLYNVYEAPVPTGGKAPMRRLQAYSSGKGKVSLVTATQDDNR